MTQGSVCKALGKCQADAQFCFRCKASRLALCQIPAVAAKAGVPWAVIAVIHERECSQDWTGSFAHGDPWNMVSVHAHGRGPFRSWEVLFTSRQGGQFRL